MPKQATDHQRRHFSWLDHVVMFVDSALHTMTGSIHESSRPYPRVDTQFNHNHTYILSKDQQTLSGRLMRVNHCGEVCAQALYAGQAILARNSKIQEHMQQAASEENDHLAWCLQRLKELDTHPSYLNPVWYMGSLAIGMLAGALGDRWSLGFLAETEHQVGRHLHSHLQMIPLVDSQTRKVIEQIAIDEAHHAEQAQLAGAKELPEAAKKVMAMMSKVMTTLAYWI